MSVSYSLLSSLQRDQEDPPFKSSFQACKSLCGTRFSYVPLRHWLTRYWLNFRVKGSFRYLCSFRSALLPISYNFDSVKSYDHY